MPASGGVSSEFRSPTRASPVSISDTKPPRPSNVYSEASGGGCTTLRNLEVGVSATRHVCGMSGQGKGMHSSCKRDENSTDQRKSDTGILERRNDLTGGFLSLPFI